MAYFTEGRRESWFSILRRNLAPSSRRVARLICRLGGGGEFKVSWTVCVIPIGDIRYTIHDCFHLHYNRSSLVPRPHPAFCRLQYGKVGEALVRVTYISTDTRNGFRLDILLFTCLLRVLCRTRTSTSSVSTKFLIWLRRVV